MELYHSLILGLIQGLTEFLPISSSGHLVIFQKLFGLEEPEIFFDISLHLGTLVAVLFYFRQEVTNIATSLIKSSLTFIKRENTFKEAFKNGDSRMGLLIIAGCFPTAVIGLLLNKIADQLFSSLILAGSMLLLTGFVLWLTTKIDTEKVTSRNFSFAKGIAIGVIQGIAIIPGISRSGSTIAAALFMGLDKETAARFSFLISIPAIAGAALLKFRDIPPTDIQSLDIILPGTLVSAVTGYLALKFLVFIVKKGRLHLFAPYCWACGTAAIVLGLK